MTKQTLQAYLDAVMPAVSTGIDTEPHYSPRGELEQRKQILAEIAAKPKKNNAKRMVAGAAGFFNFDMAAAGDYGAVALFDINMRQAVFWREVCRFIIANPTRAEFRRNFEALRQHDDTFYPQLRQLSLTMGADTFLGDSVWANTDEGYQKIRKLAMEGRIGAVTLDINDVKRCAQLGNALRTFNNRSFKVDLVYGSNIWEFMSPQMENNFTTPLRALHIKSLEIARKHARKPDQDVAMRTHILDEFSPRFASPGPSEEQKSTLVQVTLEALEKGGILYHTQPGNVPMALANANDRFIELLSRRCTMSDIAALGFGRPSQGGFYKRDGAPPPTLDGLRVIGGQGSIVYLCDTSDPRAVIKLEGGTQKGGRGGK